jgi:FPC/CPF motif-containing protein YcgG
VAESTAFDGYGVGLGIGSGASSGEVFSDFAEILDVAGPSFAKDTIDVAHSTSPDKYREFIAGFKDAGEVTLTLNMVQADFAAILAKFELETTNNYQLTIPDDNYSTKPTIVFAGHVTSIGSAYPTQDKVTQDITFKITGKPTYTQGS